MSQDSRKKLAFLSHYKVKGDAEASLRGAYISMKLITTHISD